MAGREFPEEFRRRVLDLVESGRPVAQVARELGISTQAVYNWRRQDRIDKGLSPGLTSGEKAELVAARRRIARLGSRAEGRAAGSGAVEGGDAPKGGTRRSE